jgi:hypothetical protein
MRRNRGHKVCLPGVCRLKYLSSNQVLGFGSFSRRAGTVHWLRFPSRTSVPFSRNDRLLLMSVTNFGVADTVSVGMDLYFVVVTKSDCTAFVWSFTTFTLRRE